MRITPDQLLDRIQLKKQVNYWRIISIMLLLLIIVAFLDDSPLSNKLQVTENSYIARISVNGTILQDLRRMQNIENLAKNSAVKGVVLHINSPGGTVVGGQSMYMAIKKLAAAKPVAVVMGDMATSAGYMMALGGHYIVAYDCSVTGSIGVLSESFDVTDLAERIGIKFHHFKSSNVKGGPSPTEPLTPEMRQSMQDLIEDIYTMFVAVVAKERKLPRADVMKIADGRAYTGRQALTLKLIDALGNEDTAVQWMCSKHELPSDIKVLDYRIDPHESRLDQILNATAEFTKVISSMAQLVFMK